MHLEPPPETATTCAVVLAGGLGTRMGRLSAHRPKHLLEVAGEPFIVHQLRWLASHDVSDVVLATSFLADQFEPVLGDGSRWGLRLRYSTETSPRGTGGGLALAAQAFEQLPELVVVVNGDLLTAHDLTRQLALSAGSPSPDAVLHLRTVPDPGAFGSVVADEHGRVTEFVEKSSNPPSNEINAGTYVLSRAVIEGIPDGVVSLEADVLPVVVARGRTVAYREQALWEDVGSPLALIRASRKLVAASGRESSIDATAVVARDARITDGSAIGPGARVHAGALVSGSVVMAGATVGSGADILGSVVGPGMSVPDGATVRADVIA